MQNTLQNIPLHRATIGACKIRALQKTGAFFVFISGTWEERSFAILYQELEVPWIKFNACEVEILFTVDFILFYNLHESIVPLQMEKIWQFSVEMYSFIIIFGMPKSMIYDMKLLIHLY